MGLELDVREGDAARKSSNRRHPTRSHDPLFTRNTAQTTKMQIAWVYGPLTDSTRRPLLTIGKGRKPRERTFRKKKESPEDE